MFLEKKIMVKPFERTPGAISKKNLEFLTELLKFFTTISGRIFGGTRDLPTDV